MRDISLHLLDLAQNSIQAGAKNIDISFALDAEGILLFSLRDDGKGMSDEFLRQVTSPFATTRTTRKVGLGIPLMKQNAELTGGIFHISSVQGQGTTLEATFDTRSIDCLPLGDLAGTMVSLILANPDSPEFSLSCASEKGKMTFETREVRAAVAGVPLCETEIIAWIKESIEEEIQPIFGGVLI